MVTLLVIADDFTGALDTGVQFSAQGIATKVVIGEHLVIGEDEEAKVLVIDTETRHISDEAAYERVYGIVEAAVAAGVPYIYKKTDSALRGNVAGEILAAKEASGVGAVPFIPAFPKMNRLTIGGIHYIDGQPVSKSVFGIDPFEPVLQDSVKEIILSKRQADIVEILESDMEEGAKKNGILIFDTTSDASLKTIAGILKRESLCRVMAGCAGFAAFLPELLDLNGRIPEEEKLPEKLFVICGSVNPITRAQLSYGEKKGYPKFNLAPFQKTDVRWWYSEDAEKLLTGVDEAFAKAPCCIIDSNDNPGVESMTDYSARMGMTIEDVRVSISETLGAAAAQVIRRDANAVYLMTGGDTLMGLMKHIGLSKLTPLREMAPGSVLTKLEWDGVSYYIITKSGGFGDEDLLEKIVDYLNKQAS